MDKSKSFCDSPVRWDDKEEEDATANQEWLLLLQTIQAGEWQG